MLYAGMAELADAYGSGPYERKFMQVQVLLPAPSKDADFDTMGINVSVLLFCLKRG